MIAAMASLSRSIATLLVFGLVPPILVGATGLAYLREQSGDLPSLTPVLDYRPERHSTFLDRTGKTLFIVGRERRDPLTYVDFPKHLVNAFVAAEDQNFFQHAGVDPLAVLRAAVTNMREDAITSGASTITQQLVKNLVLSSERSLERKVHEALLAMELERQLSKEEILTRYLNEIYLGRGAYGVASAAEVYFGKTVGDLTIAEAALLAGLPKAPSKYGSDGAAARERMSYVLERMRAEGMIDDAQREAAFAESVRFLSSRPEDAPAGRWQSHYGQAAISELRRHGQDAGLETDGHIVTLALDPVVQAALEDALRGGLIDYDHRKGQWRGPLPEDHGSAPVPNWLAAKVERTADGLAARSEAGLLPFSEASLEWGRRGPRPLSEGMTVWIEPKGALAELRQVPEVQGSAVAMDPRTGEVLGLVGAFSERVDHFDRATRAQRQPGSALKPFIYAMALEAGWSPTSPILDAEVAFDGGKPGEIWRPGDHGFSDRGYVTLRSGLEYSRNTVTLRLFQSLGLGEVAQMMQELGIYAAPKRNASLALGSQETSLLDVVSAYTVFAGDGIQVDPTFLKAAPGDRVQPGFGYEPFDAITRTQIRSMLQGVAEYGTAWRAFENAGYTMHGKTGTSNDAKDAWFIGFTGQLIVGVHVGFDEPEGLGKGEGGGSTAAPIVRATFDALPASWRTSNYPFPAGAEMIEIDPDTGLPAEGGFVEIVRRGNP
jgi:penicillin-binding protein 1A